MTAGHGARATQLAPAEACDVTARGSARVPEGAYGKSPFTVDQTATTCPATRSGAVTAMMKPEPAETSTLTPSGNVT